jgi:hypothetical protein
MKTRFVAFGLWISLDLLSAGCAGLNERVLESKTETLRARSIQTRVLDTNDRERTLRDVIATLADLGFWVDKADATLGVVKGSKSGLTMYLEYALTTRGACPATRRMGDAALHVDLLSSLTARGFFSILLD